MRGWKGYEGVESSNFTCDFKKAEVGKALCNNLYQVRRMSDAGCYRCPSPSFLTYC